MKKEQQVASIIEILKQEYPDAICTLDYENPVQLLVATQLAAQCTDARVNIVTKTLFQKYPDAEAFATADYETLCEEIHSTGFFRSKARHIIDCCQILCEKYNGEVPSDMKELTALPGVGRKTASIIRGDVYHLPAVVTDTHAMRLSYRMGLTQYRDNPYKIEMDLAKIIPPDEQADFCHRLVEHGRAVCMARRPNCAECALADYCKKVGVKA